jgi:hypothetical protein
MGTGVHNNLNGLIENPQSIHSSASKTCDRFELQQSICCADAQPLVTA